MNNGWWQMGARWMTALALLGLTGALGCGDDGDKGAESARLSDAVPAPQGDPLVLTSANAGLSLQPPYSRRNNELVGDLTLIQGTSRFEEITTRFERGVITVPILDERRRLALSIAADEVRNNPAPFRPSARLDDLFDEIDETTAAEGQESWDSYVLVIDLFRVKGNWLVRWDGVNISDFEEPGQYGLWRADMRAQITEAIFAALDRFVEERNITHLVIGDEMERLLLTGDGLPGAPEEFANFVDFYRDLKGEIQADYPDLKISAGVNWDRLVTDVAALYTPGGAVGEVQFAEIRRAWQEVAEPLYNDSDFLALAAEPEPSYYEGDPEKVPESQYALLAEVQGQRPVIWYAVNWPVTSGAEKNTQKEYLERFLTLNAGNNIELVTWKGMVDLPLQAECQVITGLGGPVQDCFSGFLSDSTAPTRVSDVFIPPAE